MVKQEFSRVLVPTDGSEGSMQAADIAIGIAEKNGAQIIEIHVVNIDQYLQAIGVYRISYPDSQEND